MNWWCAKGDQKSGPMDDAAFRAKIQDGSVLPEDLVWNESMATWMRAGEVPGLLGGAPAAGPEAGGGDGTTPNAELMRMGREALSGQWGLAIGVTVLLNVISQAESMIPYLGILVAVALAGPIQIGNARFFLALVRRGNPDLGLAFTGFSEFGRALIAALLVSVFTLLWMLLLIVPGLIKSFSYAMTWFILADNPAMSPSEAIDRSKAMMDGRKWKLFCLSWRFIGWILLAVFGTCCIGLLWVLPYMQAAMANFYNDVKARAPADQPPAPAF